MLDMLVTAATDPGKAGMVCRLKQFWNMLAMLVTAATDPGKAGMVCRL